ncbi:MAG: DUF2235 domain-containing protein [Nocardioidaceae bacterium]|nr:DUF2235 domain-containing protein [Nocardioidaceae bacterium]
MKRLVICFDGTWKGPTDDDLSNVEKIARTVESREGRTDVQQSVIYVGGVGSDFYRTNRLLGGLWGFGLFSNLVIGYRWLALNYEPGDDVFVIGFSRGAFTARSLAGIVDRVGLLTRRALVDGFLPDAVRLYRELRTAGADARNEEFKAAHCHAETPLEFVGVFDTVGALGPWADFHDLELSRTVRHVRQALAIDERRLAFEPLLWVGGPDDDLTRVQQVWFDGVHTDVGGGYPEHGLADETLTWMVEAARRRGLVFNDDLLQVYLGDASPRVEHDSLTLPYRLLNLALRAWHLVRPNPRFDGTRRVLFPPGARDVVVRGTQDR